VQLALKAIALATGVGTFAMPFFFFKGLFVTVERPDKNVNKYRNILLN
jgi:hypothetical protein